ncbi:DUF6095 family protein [Sabulilitoribacter arenilitoris]|uniref:DUF6095 family protein n=1 Tax=Wocania arenilitoris TaxID=2044858 RepID=A0AAE3ERK6_9FLAO|nr:DUF6095 family protein [Wocania arenilitoris]MCF7569387.1 DUF6095 family protein [Wocania arenilitoris]
METSKTDKNLLVKGLKTMAISLGCMFLGPTLYYIALTNKEKPLYIPILIIAIIVCVLAIFFAFKGINTILDSMFKKSNS